MPDLPPRSCATPAYTHGRIKACKYRNNFPIYKAISLIYKLLHEIALFGSESRPSLVRISSDSRRFRSNPVQVPSVSVQVASGPARFLRPDSLSRPNARPVRHSRSSQTFTVPSDFLAPRLPRPPPIFRPPGTKNASCWRPRLTFRGWTFTQRKRPHCRTLSRCRGCLRPPSRTYSVPEVGVRLGIPPFRQIGLSRSCRHTATLFTIADPTTRCVIPVWESSLAADLHRHTGAVPSERSPETRSASRQSGIGIF